MKINSFLIPFFAVMIIMTLSFASSAIDSSRNIADPGSLTVEFNSITLPYNGPVSGIVGETVPVRVTFKADMDATDVKVKVSMEGNREEISASTDRFDVIDGSLYTKLLNLELPTDEKDLTQEYTLYVEIVSAQDRTEKMFTILMQRESYTLKILSVDYNSMVSAGDVLPVSVVAKNNGFNRADDNYLVVSIPSLGVSARGYIGDLVFVEDNNNDDEKDSTEKTVYLKIPENAKVGVYEMEVRVYNEDSNVIVKKLISISDSGSFMVLAAVKNKDLNAGETVTYDLVIVNSADSIKVFNIRAVSGDVLDVSAPSVVTVGPDSSETVSILVSAKDDAKIGTYTFSVDVDGKQAVFGANVVGSSTSTSFVALTVVLVIIFLILLAVLIVLLTTRKEKSIEEVETSYY